MAKIHPFSVRPTISSERLQLYVNENEKHSSAVCKTWVERREKVKKDWGDERGVFVVSTNSNPTFSFW